MSSNPKPNSYVSRCVAELAKRDSYSPSEYWDIVADICEDTARANNMRHELVNRGYIKHSYHVTPLLKNASAKIESLGGTSLEIVKKAEVQTVTRRQQSEWSTATTPTHRAASPFDGLGI